MEGNNESKSDCVMVFCAHNDDNIVGAGGTIAKYAKEGIRVITIIFSYGEMSHPHLRDSVIIGMRVKESQRAQNILGEDKIIYLGLKEGQFADDAKNMNIHSKIKKLIKKYKPVKIFNHSIDDLHPDHLAVYNIMNRIFDDINYKGEVYSFDVWNPVNFRKRDSPKLVVDITGTFKKKVNAFKAHKSQWQARIMLMWSIYLKAIVNGRNNDVKYAEVFYKIR